MVFGRSALRLPWRRPGASPDLHRQCSYSAGILSAAHCSAIATLPIQALAFFPRLRELEYAADRLLLAPPSIRANKQEG